MRVNIISETDRRIPRKKIKSLISLLEEEEEPPESTVNFIFVKDNKITALNKEYLGHHGPTDVISFNIDDTPGTNSIFGEIYISTDTASINAAKYGAGLQEELLRLCCHGFLHLLGYDHEKDEDNKLMREKQEYYLNRVLS